MVEELIEKLLSEHQEEDDKCLSEPPSCPPGATFPIFFIFPIGPAANLMLRAPNILCNITHEIFFPVYRCLLTFYQIVRIILVPNLNKMTYIYILNYKRLCLFVHENELIQTLIQLSSHDELSSPGPSPSPYPNIPPSVVKVPQKRKKEGFG